MDNFGAVAAGHELTATAAEMVLREGGNAFDAIVAAQFAACVAEPVLASLAGGGYLLAHPAGGEPEIYDFFAQTPIHKATTDGLDFYPIEADFGTAVQEFHIGLGSAATPGTVRGMFEIHRRFGSMPVIELMTPAIEAARRGVVIDGIQEYIFNIVKAIYIATPEARAIYHKTEPDEPGKDPDKLLRQPELADTMEVLAIEGDRLFYEGEIARLIADQSCRGGGHLRFEDLQNYRTILRRPLSLNHRGATLLTNPPPSAGGILIAFALGLLEQKPISGLGRDSPAYLDLLTQVMAATNKGRLDALADAAAGRESHLLDEAYLEIYRREVAARAQCLRGTTHISVVDRRGNIAAMTVSNGEGCGHMIPGTGVMLNNILGEEDLNPLGFHQWRENQRMTSMMSPSLLEFPSGRRVALGSGGSNRIRTALLQVICNLVDFELPLSEAVAGPRIHYENGLLNVEPGFPMSTVEQLTGWYPDNLCWRERNLYFGGVHSVEMDGVEFNGIGDIRRGGVGRG